MHKSVLHGQGLRCSWKNRQGYWSCVVGKFGRFGTHVKTEKLLWSDGADAGWGYRYEEIPPKFRKFVTVSRVSCGMVRSENRPKTATELYCGRE